MATTQQLYPIIGRTGRYLINSLEVDVMVVDSKVSYGQVRIKIEPLSGLGSIWVDAYSVIFDEAPRQPLKINQLLPEVN